MITTGLGGDCGFDFEFGQQYLVYASKDTSGEMSTNICSGTGLLQESGSDLAFLRGEPASSDATARPAGASSGKLYGHVVGIRTGLADGQVLLKRVGSKSPIPNDEADVAADGSFCFTGTPAGKYYLAFASGPEDPVAFEFYPEAANSSGPGVIELKAGETQSGLVFHIPRQRTFSLRGHVLLSGGTTLPPESKALLVRVDPLPFMVGYSQDVDANGSFYFPNVLPGKYWGFVGIDSETPSKWATRKLEVDVNRDLHEAKLELVRK